MGVAVAPCGFEQGPGEQTECPDKIDRRKAAAGLLTLALWPAGLISRSIGHREAGAIDGLDVAAVPELLKGDAALQPVHQMGLDLLQDIEGDFGPGLTVGTGVRTHGCPFLARKFRRTKAMTLRTASRQEP